jgi:hypothetical protein
MVFRKFKKNSLKLTDLTLSLKFELITWILQIFSHFLKRGTRGAYIGTGEGGGRLEVIPSSP